MHGVRVGIDQRHGNCLDRAALQGLQRFARTRFIQFAHDLAARTDSLAHFDRVLERRERLRLGPDYPSRKTARHVGARHLKNLAVALGRDQPDARALSLQHGIGGYRGAVHQLSESGRLDSRDRAHAFDSVQNGRCLVGRGRRHFGAKGCACIFVDQQQVGESSTHVDAESVRHLDLQSDIICRQGRAFVKPAADWQVARRPRVRS